MNSAIPSPVEPFRLKPWSMIAGFAIGLAALAYAGRSVSSRNYHAEFTRFHPMIGPESQYEPTVSEMRAIVRSAARPDQVLVIVGGNSILYGVGQPADRMWTKRLQQLLGDQYAVVNLAFRGSTATDGGAIVAESLRDEYPRQIYIANSAPVVASNAGGSPSYRFIILDAYYKGMLLPWKPRDDDLIDWFTRSNDRTRAFEQRLYARTDAVLRFHDFWNWWTMTRYSTFATPLMPRGPEAHWPRNKFQDNEPDFLTLPTAERFKPEFIAADLAIARQSTAYYSKAADGSWTPSEAALTDFKRFAKNAFPDQLKPRTLLLVSRNSPFYTRQLPQEIRDRDEVAIRDSVAWWQEFGYQSMDYGADYVPDDFGDRTHLTTSGGSKLAAAVAPRVRTMAANLGYLKR